MMKKKVAVAVCLSMALMLAACGSDAKSAAEQNSQVQSTQSQAVQESSAADTAASGDSAAEEAVDGGWEVNSGSLAMKDNKEAEAVFKKAIDGLTGCDYEPVAFLGSQVVAGTNYCILCKSTIVVPDAQSGYVLMYINEDLSGKTKIMSIADIDQDGIHAEDSAADAASEENTGADASASEEILPGGWQANQEDASVDQNADVEKAFTKATEGLDGTSYEGVAYLASQVVAGTNYCILCRTAAVVPDPQYSYSLVRIYADLDGNAKVTGETPLDISGGAVYH